MVPDPDTLKQARILQGISSEQLGAIVAASAIVVYQRDEVVFEEASDGRDMYIVIAGEVAVMLDPARLGTVERGSVELRVIRRMGPGESFGELALVDGQPRTATIAATQPDTTLLVLSPQVFDDIPAAQLIIRNIAREITRELRNSNAREIESLLSGYYLTVLTDELATGAYECSPIIPLQHLVVIRSAENFILSGPGQLVTQVPEQEAIKISFFSRRATLQHLAGQGSPSGAIILNALFSLIRSGRVSTRIAEGALNYEVKLSDDRRTGTLIVWKTVDDISRSFTIAWQVKGTFYHVRTRTTNAFLTLTIFDNPAWSTARQAESMIAGIAMPVQRQIINTLPQPTFDPTRTRVLVIHHRSHEVARTLRTIRDLGYQLDTFIGIPYGDVNWDYITLLQHAANHNYLSLKLITHPMEPSRYQFDFEQSSLLDVQAEQDLFARYEDPAIAGDYLTAMQALAEYRLIGALIRCNERRERLLIYEDGGYVVAKIYGIYNNPDHPQHALMQSAVNDGVIVGVVEVTVAGERKNQQIIAENNGHALFPVLSNARSDIKAVYEAVGVGEAVIHAAATSFGRLGLPTFQNRRIAVIGGNGAIGTRLVEQLTMLHNSTANVVAVDVSLQPFVLKIDAVAVPYAATRLQYRHLPRFVVDDTCLPVILDVPLSTNPFELDGAAAMRAVLDFLTHLGGYQTLAVTNSAPLPDAQRWWNEVAARSGFHLVEQEVLRDERGTRYHLQRGDVRKRIVLLATPVVLVFPDVGRPIRSGINTIVGSTGFSIFSAQHLDDFFARRTAANEVDELALISASSKDYEFRRAIDFLNTLVALQTEGGREAADIGWFTEAYRAGMSFLRDDDFDALQALLLTADEGQSIERFRHAAPRTAQVIGLTHELDVPWQPQVAAYLAHKVRQNVTVRKELRPDIGSIYHLRVNGMDKRVVVLADGLVVNFFARHEKGVKTEYIDPIVTMQVLSLVRLSSIPVPPGLHKMDAYLRPEDLASFWSAINESCRPLTFP